MFVLNTQVTFLFKAEIFKLQLYVKVLNNSDCHLKCIPVSMRAYYEWLTYIYFINRHKIILRCLMRYLGLRFSTRMSRI